MGAPVKAPMDAEDLKREVDKLDEELQGKRSDIDQAKVDADIAALRELAAAGQRQEAVDGLLAVEKQGRLGEDIVSTRKACTAILEIMVRQAMSYLPNAPSKEAREEAIRCLLAITEGKIYVEIERARLTRQLARMKEEEGNSQEAAEILQVDGRQMWRGRRGEGGQRSTQGAAGAPARPFKLVAIPLPPCEQEVAVETFGAMAKTEKIAYILEQVRLCLQRKDYVRAHILSKKVSPRAFAVRPEGTKKGESTGEIGIEGTAIEAPEEGTPSLEELKLEYYGQMVLRKVCWYVVLAPVDSHQASLLALAAGEKRLEAELPGYARLLRQFSGAEVLWWRTVSKEYEAEMAAQSDVFDGEWGRHAADDFRLRVVEHNIRVVAKYYRRVSTARLAQLLDLTPAEAERHLADMVVANKVVAKIDRPAGVVRFAAPAAPAAALNAWSSNLGRLLETVEKACQQIQKESMVHKVPIGAPARGALSLTRPGQDGDGRGCAAAGWPGSLHASRPKTERRKAGEAVLKSASRQAGFAPALLSVTLQRAASGDGGAAGAVGGGAGTHMAAVVLNGTLRQRWPKLVAADNQYKLWLPSGLAHPMRPVARALAVALAEVVRQELGGFTAAPAAPEAGPVAAAAARAGS
eukprot:scaffold14.g1021.t1